MEVKITKDVYLWRYTKIKTTSMFILKVWKWMTHPFGRYMGCCRKLHIVAYWISTPYMCAAVVKCIKYTLNIGWIVYNNNLERCVRICFLYETTEFWQDIEYALSSIIVNLSIYRQVYLYDAIQQVMAISINSRAMIYIVWMQCLYEFIAWNWMFSHAL